MSNIRAKNRKLLIFTGGHHTSGLVVALEARRRGWNVVWIGHKYSMAKDQNLTVEYREVTANKIPFYELRTGKIFGSGNFLSIIQVITGLFKSFFLLRQLKSEYQSCPIGIVSFGGYLAVPVVLAGWVLEIPSITHEQTQVGGGANRLISLFVRKIALTWSGSQKYFPKSKSVVTGLPLRSEIKNITRKSSVGQPLTVFITGGKQGSHILNSLIFDHLGELLDKFHVIHQTGSNSVYADLQRGLRLKSQLPETLSKHYQIQEYFSTTEIADILSAVDVVVGRSGAHTTYELGFLGIPSVLIPIPWSSRGEQLANAKFLASVGRAVILPQQDLAYSSLIQSIDTAISQKTNGLSLPQNGTENLLNLIGQTFAKNHEVQT